LLWKCSFWSGLAMLLAGTCLLTYGFLNKEKPPIVGSLTSNVNIVDTFAVSFNDSLQTAKVVGFLVFMLGGGILAAALLLPSFLCYKQCIYHEDALFDEDPNGHGDTGTPLGSAGGSKPTRLVDFKHIQPQSLNKMNSSTPVVTLSDTSLVNYKTIKSEY
jgi:hypothetical protein